MMKALLDSIGRDSAYLVDGLLEGFDLTSKLHPSGWFPELRDKTEPNMSREQLLMSATQLIDTITKEGSPPGPCKDKVALHEVTLQEVDKGWAEGPLSLDQLDERYGKGGWRPAHRFGIYQSAAGKAKLRPIDDFRIHGHNQCTGSCEQLDIGGLDEIIALSRALGSALKTGTLDVRDIHGKRTCIQIDPEWVGRDISIWSLDLKSAYKQLPVLARDPFGSVASVYAFNAYSRMIEVLLCELCALPTSSYFDDFVAIDTSVTSSSASALMEALLDSLGWAYDREGDKHNEFDKDKTILGASVKVDEAGVDCREHQFQAVTDQG